jgi:hypothetical protein
MTLRRILLTAVFAAAASYAQEQDPMVASANRVLDDFHDAAAKGDKSRYLGQLTDDAVFLGTDERERWAKIPDFTAYVDSRFGNGRGWAYRSVDRHVQLDDTKTVAWFDEVVFSQTNGRFRGTGVLVREGSKWKIAHYALSFLIDNDDWDAVIELTRRPATTQGP